jgi:ketosteroid isomerase-like protein
MIYVDRHALLIAAHEKRLKALLAGDLESLKTVVGEDMVFVSSFGETSSFGDVVAACNAGTMRILRMDASDISVRIYGDIGILIYKADAKMTHGEATVEGITRSTTVYAFRDGGWQMISQHQSLIGST